MKQKQQITQKKIRVVLYARVRSLDPKGRDLQTKREDLENQLKRGREVVSKCGWEIVGEYTDFQVRGNNSKPKLEELAERAAQKGDFEKILVYSLDRICRQIWYYQTMVNHFFRFGVTVEASLVNPHNLIQLPHFNL